MLGKGQSRPKYKNRRSQLRCNKKAQFQEGVEPGCELLRMWHMGFHREGEKVPTILEVPVDGDAQGAAESERRSSVVAMTHTGGNDEAHVQVCRGEL